MNGETEHLADNTLFQLVCNGAHVGCPFCVASLNSLVPIGNRLVHLDGFEVGSRGLVIDHNSEARVLITIQDGAPPEFQRRVNRALELVIDESSFSTPPWAPPASLSDYAHIHSSMIEGWRAELSSGVQSALRSSFLQIVVAIWWLRLPLSFDDLWPSLEAHGWPIAMRGLLEDRFDFSMTALRLGAGRKAIKRKRVEAFFVPR